ncbi:hypothetical protein Plhal304r1_c005g0020121 [Plasmopara halstedii]
MVRIAPCGDSIDARGSTRLIIDHVLRNHGFPDAIVMFDSLVASGKKCSNSWHRSYMTTAVYSKTDGQTERAN